MDAVGIKKEIDKLGRICIPKEMRTLFKLEHEVELQITKDGILIKNPEYILVKKSKQQVEDFSPPPFVLIQRDKGDHRAVIRNIHAVCGLVLHRIGLGRVGRQIGKDVVDLGVGQALAKAVEGATHLGGQVLNAVVLGIHDHLDLGGIGQGVEIARHHHRQAHLVHVLQDLDRAVHSRSRALVVQMRVQKEEGLFRLAVLQHGGDRKSTRLNSSHAELSRMPSSA